MNRPFRLMLIDDNYADCLLAEEALNYPGLECEFTFSDSGPAVLASFKAGAQLPDLLLLDVNMPEMNGFEILKVIKTTSELWHLPVGMLSTSKRPKDITEAYDLQANFYIVKSLEFSGFQRQLSALLSFWRSAMLPSPKSHKSAKAVPAPA
ncbi:response regulator [Deinococcus psychrotolerans]|uniref:Response regulator n=1 Tax=Deinococcus psychrotolerans TaxID=2489213 RepID=A0A3G8YFA9_9DEIO|nr:response regulator [Deinococcus psychrotolerans]AZI44019.1 response regulator [Deinococcus psychrotolerans]